MYFSEFVSTQFMVLLHVYITMQYSALLSTMQNSFALKKFFPTALCDAFNKGKNPSNTKDSIVQRKMFGL